MKSGAALVGMLNPFDRDNLHRLAGSGLTSCALEAAPRTTRAQSMHVLSSPANIAGYKAVIMAADQSPRVLPLLMTAARTATKPGSVIVDLAAIQGGNCPLTEAGRTVVKHGVTLIGETNLPALVAADASALYARNVLDFLKLVITKEGTFNVPMDDDIVVAC